MNIEFKYPINIKNDNITLQKLLFINNALNSGWTIKKEQEKYIFTKRHENNQDVYLDNYLEIFLNNNMTVSANN